MHWLVRRSLFAALAGLGLLAAGGGLAAAAKLVHPEFDLPGTDPGSVRKYAVFLQRAVQPMALASVSSRSFWVSPSMPVDATTTATPN